MSLSSKVYRLGRENFKLPLGATREEGVFFRDASRLPTLYWPNGRWCVEGNMFLLELLDRALSRSVRGGTILVYATHIGHLIKYCYRNQIMFHEITDNEFSHFVRGLHVDGQTDKSLTYTRSHSTIAQIGRTCLTFLDFVGALYGVPGMIGPRGTVRAKKVHMRVGASGRANRYGKRRYVWSHPALPIPSARNRGMPISREDIERLKGAAVDISDTNFLLKRRLAMILAFEMTGARRSEVAALNTQALSQALAMDAPMLRLTTLKRGGNRTDERLVPVSRIDLLFLQEFVEKNRARIIRKTVGSARDEGFVFVSQRTGLRLSSEYLGQEFWKLRQASGIEARVHAHSFRHRFVTKVFIQMVKMHEFRSSDDFRRALISTSGLRQKLAEWTGHRDVASLDHYIDLAFDELSGFDETLDMLRDVRTLDSTASQLDAIAAELGSGEDGKEAARRLKRIAASLKMPKKKGT